MRVVAADRCVRGAGVAEEQARVVLRAILAALGLLLGACGVIVPTAASGPATGTAGSTSPPGSSLVTTTSAPRTGGGGAGPYGGSQPPLPPVGSNLQLFGGVDTFAAAVAGLRDSCRQVAGQEVEAYNAIAEPTDRDYQEVKAAVARVPQCEKDVAAYFVAMPLVLNPANAEPPGGLGRADPECGLKWDNDTAPRALYFWGQGCESPADFGEPSSALRRSVVEAAYQRPYSPDFPEPSLPPPPSTQPSSSSSRVSSSSSSTPSSGQVPSSSSSRSSSAPGSGSGSGS